MSEFGTVVARQEPAVRFALRLMPEVQRRSERLRPIRLPIGEIKEQSRYPCGCPIKPEDPVAALELSLVDRC